MAENGAAAEAAIDVAGEAVHLLPERAIYWPRQRTQIVTDLHLGKAAAFRAAAIPLPAGTTQQTLDRLSTAVARTGADQIVILGDLLPARSGRADRTLGAFSTWRASHPDLAVLLVRGNHDRWAGDPPDDWRFVSVDEPAPAAPFVYRHYPEPAWGGYVLAGHLHPAVTRSGRGHQSLRLPCFHFGAQVATLPAFGAFTGSALIRPRPDDRVYVVLDDSVLATH